MKKFFTLVLAFVCCMSLFTFTSCEEEEKPDVNLTPDENKVKLEEIGLTFLSKIDPTEHEELIRTLKTFEELAEEGDLDITAATEFSQNVRQIVSRTDLGRFAAYNAYESEIYRAGDYYGIYTYNEDNEEWDLTESDSKLEFIFPVDGKEAVITLSASGTEVDVEIDGDTYMIPPAAEGIIKRDNNELCKLVMENRTNTSANTFYLEATLNVSGDYVFYVKADLQPKVSKAEATVTKNGELLVYGEGEVTGESMTDRDLIEEDYDNLKDLYEKADAYGQIMKDMNVVVSNPNVRQMIEELDALSWDDYNHEKEYEQARVDILNEYITAGMYYNGAEEIIAKIELQLYLDRKSDWYEYWETEPVLVFRVDSSRHTFMDYFGKNNFSNLVNYSEDLAKKYEAYLK